MTTVTLPHKSDKLCYTFNFPDDRIGTGSMSIIYKGTEQEKSGQAIKDVVIRVLKNEYLTNQNAINAFNNGSKDMLNIHHQNLMKVYDLIQKTGKYHVIVEYINGNSYNNLIKNRLTTDVYVEYILQLLDGLEAIHDNGFIHRDIKPSNILISQSEVLKVIDYDCVISQSNARNNDGSFVGTRRYASPEQINTDNIDLRSDLWAVGIILYESIVGSNPWRQLTDDQEISNAILNTNINIPPDVDSKMAGIIKKSLERNPGDRFQSAVEFKDALENYLNPSRSDKIKSYLLSIGYKEVFILVIFVLVLIILILLINS